MNAVSDIIIVGGGIIGLALALELRAHGANVTVLCRDFKEAAAHAAAGMLAPQAEAIPPGAMLDLCLGSRSLYPEWIEKLETITGIGTGYWRCGILAPVYVRLTSPEAPPLPSKEGTWLDKDGIAQFQPGLNSEVIGGWWYPEDAQVDNRALVQALWAAALQLGVNVREGVAVESIEQQHQKITGVSTSLGVLSSEHYVLATGAWSNQLLPVPVYPKKGQMLSVQVPSHQTQLPLQRVLFGEEIYIVPRQDGRIVLGATKEEVGFTPDNTPYGIQKLLAAAIRLYPELQHFPIQEFWWGFRPTTPDEMPILGSSAYDNLTFATGHYRNGILLAPITAKLVADWIWQQKSHPLLSYFHYSRFAGI